MRKRGKIAAEAVKQIQNLIHRLPPDLVSRLLENGVDEQQIFISSIPFFSKEFGIPVQVIPSEETEHPKGRGALPFKPAILIE
jgi:leucyl-tRNA synthetase